MNEITANVTMNMVQQLYILQHGSSYTCLGFGIAMKRLRLLSKELNVPSLKNMKLGSIEVYREYERLLSKALDKNIKSGWRSKTELVQDLIGLEGKHVEGVYFDEPVSFIVGKSTSYIPAHLMIKSMRSSGGEAISSDNFKFTRII